jgi:hypothetical protein
MESIKKTPQYYKPTFDEFCLGFEYEYQIKTNEWIRKNIHMRFTDWEMLDHVLGGGQIRVRCLDEEDILSLGFSSKNQEKIPITKWIKGDIEIGYWRDEFSNDVEYCIFNVKRNNYCFIGKIRNKLELIKILNMVSIDAKYDINLDVSD